MKSYYYKFEGNGMNYYIEKYDNYVVTHVFVDDPSEQIKIGLPGIYGKRDYTKNIINLEINKNNLQKCGLIGVNCSGFVTNRFDPFFLKMNKGYNNTPITPIMINNGEIIRDYSDTPYPKNYLTYGITKDGLLVHYNFGTKNNDKTREELLYDGVQNTFGFRPLLIFNGEINPNLNEGTFCTSNNLRNAIGQVTRNYFVLVTVTTENRELGFNLQELALLLKSYGCNNAYNLDGGRSINYFYKKDTEDIKYLKKSKRMVADVIYFKEK